MAGEPLYPPGYQGYTQTAHSLEPAVPGASVMSIQPKNTHRYPLPITRAMLQRPQDPPSDDILVLTPVTTSLEPASAPVNTLDLVLNVYGSNFTPQSRILWNGAAETTDFINGGQLQTVVKASMATVPSTATVAVITGALTSSPDLTFSFT